MKIRTTIPVLLITLAALSGCKSSRPPVGSEPFKSTLDAFLDSSEDPRRHWLTAYQTNTGPRFENAFRAHENDRAELSFASPKKSYLPLVRFQSRYIRRTTALIDTASRYSYLDMHYAGTMRAIPIGTPPFMTKPVHVPNGLESYACVISQFRINKIDLDSGVIFVRPQYRTLGPLARELPKKRMPMMLIGNDVLSSLSAVQFNWDARRVRLLSTKRFKPRPERLHGKLKLKRLDGSLSVYGEIGSYKGPVIIDTAGDYELAIPATERNRIDEIWFDNIRFRDVKIVDTFEQGLRFSRPSIGARLLSQYQITLDFKSQPSLLWFERLKEE
jgi:hypothetical protein